MEQPKRTLEQSLAGDAHARHALLDSLYESLHRLAEGRMTRERADHTLQPTALVHEAYLRLMDQEELEGYERTHILGLAAMTMRRVLVDHARQKSTGKRDRRREVGSVAEGDLVRWDDPAEILDLDAALSELARTQERQARVVELRFFAGLSLEETAEALGVSRDTVKLDWRFARAWLNRKLATE